MTSPQNIVEQANAIGRPHNLYCVYRQLSSVNGPFYWVIYRKTGWGRNVLSKTTNGDKVVAIMERACESVA